MKNLATFISFAAPISLGVHLRRYHAVDEVVLVEARDQHRTRAGEQPHQ